MTHYRIIEVIEYGNDIYYLLQIKKCLFFWVTLKSVSFSHDGGSFFEDLKFSSRSEAKEYYRKYYMKPKLTIVEEN